MAGIGIRISLIWVMYAGVVASRAQWRFGIFAVGLQMTINLNKVLLFTIVSLDSDLHLSITSSPSASSLFVVFDMLVSFWK